MTFKDCKLGDVFDIVRGGSPRPIDQFITDDPNGYNWIMIGDAADGSKYITETKKRVLRTALAKSRLVKPGDFLLTNSMSFGRPYITQVSGCIHDGWLALTPKNSNQTDRDFFYHLLASPALKREFQKRAAGAVVKNLNIGLVQDVNIRIPTTKTEQRRIAAILDKADAIRRSQNELRSVGTTLLGSAFNEIFGDFSRPLNSEGTSELGSLVDQARGISYGIVQRGANVANGIPVVRISNIVQNAFDAENLVRASREISDGYKRTVLEGNELLLSIRGTVGRVAIAPPHAAGFNVSREVAVIPLVAGVHPVFVRAVMLTPDAQRFMTENVKGVAQRGINLSDVRKLPIPKPKPDALDKFLTIVAAAQRLLRRLEKPGDILASLSQRAFRGEL